MNFKCTHWDWYVEPSRTIEENEQENGKKKSCTEREKENNRKSNFLEKTAHVVHKMIVKRYRKLFWAENEKLCKVNKKKTEEPN